MRCRLSTIAFTVAVSMAPIGCGLSSRLAGRAAFPGGVRYQTELRPSPSGPIAGSGPPHVALASAPAVGQRPGISPPGSAAEVIPTPRPNVPQNVGPPGPAEIVATPRPDGPATLPQINPGVVPPPPGTVLAGPPPAKPSRGWRGFLPSHDTDEDRPGWWTPDYRSGTSD